MAGEVPALTYIAYIVDASDRGREWQDYYKINGMQLYFPPSWCVPPLGIINLSFY